MAVKFAGPEVNEEIMDILKLDAHDSLAHVEMFLYSLFMDPFYVTYLR